MDRYFSPQSPEARAYFHLTENWLTWDAAHPSLDETLVAACATYSAFQRYLDGSDLYLVPRSRTELEKVLKRYAYDTIHNTVAKARSQLQQGGYSRACILVERSIRRVLDENDNASALLSLHPHRNSDARRSSFGTSASVRPITIK